MKLIWINENPGASADERGYWRSVEGRFNIVPRYRSCVYPDTFEVRDNMEKITSTHNTVRDAKFWAFDRVRRELINSGIQVETAR
jgi:hypothetical protein